MRKCQKALWGKIQPHGMTIKFNVNNQHELDWIVPPDITLNYDQIFLLFRHFIIPPKLLTFPINYLNISLCQPQNENKKKRSDFLPPTPPATHFTKLKATQNKTKKLWSFFTFSVAICYVSLLPRLHSYPK